MRIAYISYEHPLGISGGGIGTYIGQISKLMALRGHEVEVFSGHKSVNETLTIDGYQLHLICAKDISDFRNHVLDKFSERNKIFPFDIIESPEYGADALNVKKTFPNLPLVLKLHTPTFLISKLNNYNLSFFSKLRFIIGGLLQGKVVKPYWVYDKNQDPEFELFKLANGVCSPSRSLKQIANSIWGNKAIAVIPNVFIPSTKLLSIKRRDEKTLNVTFIGKLERRKGILDLMNAIPLVLRKNIDVKFIFVGSALASPDKEKRMDEYISDKLKRYTTQLIFKGFIPYEHITTILNEADICIFPSIWENFPTVCLEAMSAGKTVIGTNSGGMADIIEDGKTGFLISPKAPNEIARLILKLNEQRSLLKEIGENSRKHILAYFNGDIMGKTIEDFYIQTINKKP